MFRHLQLSLGMLLSGSFLLTSAFVAAADEHEHVAIHFANLHGSIRDWRADDQNVLFVQDNHKQWYRATFWTPCFDLPFAVGIGFVTGSMDELDEWSSVVVRGERCMFRTFEKSDPPPPREKGKKAPAKPDKAPTADVPANADEVKPSGATP
jgi:hypothetical protein